MAEGRFVSYLRVSTDRQGRSGLGIEAQRQAVASYLNGGAWTLDAEFVECESGKINDRPELARAVQVCRLTGAKLVIAKLDRLSRNAAFLLNLRDSGVEFVAADMPDANRMTVGIMAVIAEHEREMIARRTKDALAAAKARGTKLGGWRGGPVVNAGHGTVAIQGAADDFAQRVGPLAAAMRASGRSLSAIATELQAKGIKSARGGAWTATAVRNLLARISVAALAGMLLTQAPAPWAAPPGASPAEQCRRLSAWIDAHNPGYPLRLGCPHDPQQSRTAPVSKAMEFAYHLRP